MNRRASKRLLLTALAAAMLPALTACETAPVKDLVIKDGTTEIVARQYEDCKDLETVVIPDSVTSIGQYAFKDCKNLRSIVIPDSVTEVGMWAFYGCENLGEVSLPVSAQYDEPFLDNPNLTALTFTGDRFTEGYLHGWSFIDSLAHEGNGTSPTLYETVEKITVADSITAIGAHAFSGCRNLKTVVLPDTVTAIGDGAFGDCSHLETVVLPDSVTSIGKSAFGWSGLTAIEIPASVTSIGDGAFKNCPNLTSVTIPPSVDFLGEDLFADCKALRLAVRDLFPTDFESAEDASRGEDKLIPEGARVVPMGEWQSEENLVHHSPWIILDTSLYNRMPEDVRSADWFTADYAIILDRESYRDDNVMIITTTNYGTSVNSGWDSHYVIYLCGRDGTIRRIGYSGSTDGEDVWKSIEDRL